MNFGYGLDQVQLHVKGNLKTHASQAKSFIDTKIHYNASTETPNFSVFIPLNTKKAKTNI